MNEYYALKNTEDAEDYVVFDVRICSPYLVHNYKDVIRESYIFEKGVVKKSKVIYARPVDPEEPLAVRNKFIFNFRNEKYCLTV